MLVDLIVVRHAEAPSAGRIAGPRTCTGLTALGQQQAASVADRLHRHLNGTPATVFTSPRARAAETAAIVARRLDAPLDTVDDLRDPDCGINLDGRKWLEVLAEAEAAGRAYNASVPLAEGGEPWAAFLSRTERMLQDLLHRRKVPVAILVGHASTVRAIHQVLIGLPLDRWPAAHLDVANASLTMWKGADDRWTMICHNDHHHLDALGRTH